MNQRAAQGSIDIAREKTQYFEKIALGSGGTIGLVASVVGLTCGSLAPRLATPFCSGWLALAMIAAVYRNWKYPFYELACQARQDLSIR
jgi:hypothetical protein